MNFASWDCQALKLSFERLTRTELKNNRCASVREELSNDVLNCRMMYGIIYSRLTLYDIGEWVW